MNLRKVSSLFFIALLLISVLPVFGNEESRQREIRMGREGAREIERLYDIITDTELVERVERIGQDIAEVANNLAVEASYGKSEIYHFDYKFRILDDDSVNAFSLPGGYIYVNKGLLDYAQSDHELAGVLAHEVAHAAHHHMTFLLREQSKIDGHLALLLLIGMLGRIDTHDLGHIMMGAQLFRIAKTSGYGQKAEADADATAVRYMYEAGYNPVGMLTFLEKLARDYALKPNIEMGILQTHPAPKERCRAILKQLKSMNLPINRREVADFLKAGIEPVVRGDHEVIQVVIGDNILFEPAPIDTLSSEQRANLIATKVNRLLDNNPAIREITLSEDKHTVLARGEPIIIVTPQDSYLAGKELEEVAADAALALQRAIWQEMMTRLY